MYINEEHKHQRTFNDTAGPPDFTCIIHYFNM